MSNPECDLRTDVYENHPAPDAPSEELARTDSAADVWIAAALLADRTDTV